MLSRGNHIRRRHYDPPRSYESHQEFHLRHTWEGEPEDGRCYICYPPSVDADFGGSRGGGDRVMMPEAQNGS